MINYCDSRTDEERAEADKIEITTTYTSTGDTDTVIVIPPVDLSEEIHCY